MCEFIYSVRTKKNNQYLRTSFKNAVALISHHLKNSIPYWNYNLLDKNNFSKLYGTLDGTLKEMKRLGIGTAKPHEGLTSKEVKLILYHNATSPNEPKGLLRRAFLWICLLGCPRNAISKGKWYHDRPLGKKWVRGIFREICLACEIKISERNISNHSGRDTSIQSIFNASNEEVKAIVISGHNSSAGVCNYFKVITEKKRTILNSVLQRLTNNNDDEK
ncbi:hypothetical protein C1645_734132 [Glomus cerebriforme]|uniref:Tyr recombinase domain-containing protein n=1 Tax=Glomus cerebriforme TaxID=658196 RepID=A0A397TDB9_9GLOM|nr:hypothetical protein C1645_734132 [Glomus cerebriforme]